MKARNLDISGNDQLLKNRHITHPIKEDVKKFFSVPLEGT